AVQAGLLRTRSLGLYDRQVSAGVLPLCGDDRSAQPEAHPETGSRLSIPPCVEANRSAAGDHVRLEIPTILHGKPKAPCGGGGGRNTFQRRRGVVWLGTSLLFTGCYALTSRDFTETMGFRNLGLILFWLLGLAC